MAAIDYGALLRVNGDLVNKNKNLFMDAPNTGYVLDKARYADMDTYSNVVDIEGNFNVYAGDKNLLLAFYKGYFYVISGGLIIKEIGNVPFISETFYIDNKKIKVSHLDPALQIEKDDIGTWNDYVKENWIGITGDEKLSDLKNGSQWYKHFIKRLKRKASGRCVYKERTQRWIAEWNTMETSTKLSLVMVSIRMKMYGTTLSMIHMVLLKEKLRLLISGLVNIHILRSEKKMT